MPAYKADLASLSALQVFGNLLEQLYGVSLVMGLISICIIFFVASCFLFLWPIGFLIHRTSWAIKTKKIIFSFGGGAIVFPVLFPVDLVAIPTPNIFFVGFWLFNLEIIEMFRWYGRTFVFTGISYVITAAILGLLSRVVFIEYKGHQKHGL